MIFDKGSLRKLATAFAAVTQVVVTSLAGFGLGYLIDRSFSGRTDPWMKVVFTLAGLTLGFYKLYLVVLKDDDSSD